MSHECLYMSSRPGPMAVIGSTTVIPLGEPEWSIYCPPNSLYVGRAFRFRGGGSIFAGTPTQGLRFGIGFYTAAPSSVANPSFYHTHVQMVPRLVAGVGVTSFSFDYTMVCRTVGKTTTDFFQTAYFASDCLIDAVGTAGTKTTGTPVVNPGVAIPVVTTVKHTNVADVWMAPGAGTAGAGPIFYIQLQNYRVDSIA